MPELIFAEDEKKKRRGMQNDVAGTDERWHGCRGEERFLASLDGFPLALCIWLGF